MVYNRILGSATVPSASPSRDRLPSLTGLRFWAALVVVLYHLSRGVGEIPGISQTVWYGRSGVTFFFVLSGFVLAWTYDGNRVPVRVFLWRRFARIWPLFALTTALSVVVWLVFGNPVSKKAVAVSFTLLHAWVLDPVIAKGGNPAGWSLSDEAFFYVCFPLLLAMLAGRTPRTWLAVACGVFAATLAVWVLASQIADPTTRSLTLDYLPATRILQFILGIVAGLAVKRGWRPPVSLPVAALLVLGWHLALIPWSDAVSDREWYGAYSASQLLAGPVFALLVASAAHADVHNLRTTLSGPWMVRLGHWSFAWYLVHEIVIRIVLGTAGRPDPDSLPAIAATWLVILVTSQVLAGILYVYVERPAERAIRRLGPGGSSTRRLRQSRQSEQRDSTLSGG
ncbi:acyltransferase [Streptomyces sp. NBC_00234]